MSALPNRDDDAGEAGLEAIGSVDAALVNADPQRIPREFEDTQLRIAAGSSGEGKVDQVWLWANIDLHRSGTSGAPALFREMVAVNLERVVLQLILRDNLSISFLVGLAPVAVELHGIQARARAADGAHRDDFG